MNRFLLSIIFLASVLCAVAERPEINYDGKLLSIGTEPASSDYPFTISGFKGLNWVNRLGSLNITPRNEGLYIFSGSNTIDFYGEEGYNVIRCGRFYIISDARIKENIRPLENSLFLNHHSDRQKKASAAQIDVVEESPAESITNPDDDLLQLIRENYPNLVEEGVNGTVLVNYAELVPLLVKALQEIQEKVDDQNKRIAALTDKF